MAKSRDLLLPLVLFFAVIRSAAKNLSSVFLRFLKGLEASAREGFVGRGFSRDENNCVKRHTARGAVSASFGLSAGAWLQPCRKGSKTHGF